MRNNSIQKIPLIVEAAIGFVLNLVIGISFFYYLPSSGELATAIGTIVSSVQIIFMSFVLSVVQTIVYLLSPRKDALVAVPLLILTSFINFNVCSSIAFPKPRTKDEIIRYMKKRTEEYKKESDELLKEAKLFYPSENIVLQDKSKIVKGIKKLLSLDRQFSDLARVNDSISVMHINEIFAMNYAKPDRPSFKTISDSLECRFIFYSPNYKHFITVLTYKKDYDPDKVAFYSGTVLFCEKINNKIYTFPYTTSHWEEYTKDAFFYQAIANHFFHLGDRLRKVNRVNNGFIKKNIHPFEKGFWQSKYYFDTIKIDGTNYFRYQTRLRYNHDSTPKYTYAKLQPYIIDLDI